MESAPPSSPEKLSPRLRRILELVYAVEGVTAARVWQWEKRLAVGIKGVAGASPLVLLPRVEAAVVGLREADEAWEFGMLEDEP